MTEALASKTCTPCRGGIPPLTREQAELLHAQAPDWQLAEEAHRIERSFRFRNFREALTFVQEIGELAEAEGHHPNISFGWGNATVSLQTRKIKGLHENDFIMATQIDRTSDGHGNSGNARHSAERARDQLVERTCSLRSACHCSRYIA